jgi:Glycosyltransferase
MNILHLPIEIAGQIGAICSSLQQRGYFARGFNFFSTYLGYKEHLLNTDVFEMGRMFEEATQWFDLFHYHYGLSLYPKFKDLELLKQLGKPVVMHHWGNDVRMNSIARLHNPYVYTGDSPPEETVRRTLTTLGHYFSDVIVQDYEVLPYVEPYYRRVHVIPLAIELNRFTPAYPSLAEKNPLVVHAPTNQAFKGTFHIEKAIEALRKEMPFRYNRIEKMSHEEAVRMYRQADIVIDQILCGSYGLLSVEAMAFGKPVIAYIRPDLLPKYVGLPISIANPDTIYDVLKDLLLSPEKRLQAGLAGRSYVERQHESGKVAEQILKVYQLARTNTG